MTPFEHSALGAEFWETGRCEACPVYDMHAHMGPWRSIYFPRCEPEQMLRSMDGAGVRMACFAHHAALFSPEIGNAPAIEAVRAHPDRFRAYLSVNPHYPAHTDRDLAGFDQARDVFIGLKFLADYHKIPISADQYRKALEFADEHKLIVLLHTWSGSRYDGPGEVRKVAARHRNVHFLLGHSFNPDWESAVAVAREHPNTYLELCSVPGRRGVIEMMVGGVGSERLVYGTDLPWFDEHQAIGSLLSADITDEDRHNIMRRNAEKLLRL